jgi:fibronectin-binding autotransporter adhesin
VLNLVHNAVYAYWGAGASGTPGPAFTTQTLAGLMGDSTSIIGTENGTTVTNLIINTAASQSYTFAGVIEDVSVLQKGTNGTGGAVINVTIGGAGTEVFSGANLYTGSTTITGGTLAISTDGNLGTAPATATAGNLTLNGGQLHVTGGAPVALAATRGFTAGANGGTLRTDAGTPLTIPGPTAFSNTAATLTIAAGSNVTFSPSSNAATVAAGSSVTVATGASLVLAGSFSALSDGTTAHGVNVINNSSAAGGGLSITGTSQIVGGIDGTGTTQVNAGSALTAQHIVQSALVIGGTSTSAALVTIDASDASGNPLGQSSGLALASSLTPSGSFGDGTSGASGSLASGASSSGGASLGGSAVGSGALGVSASVPEPSSVVLLVLGSLAFLGAALRRRAERN